MQIVTAREFRSNQGKFLGAAKKGQDVLLTSRYGNFRIIPVKEEDSFAFRPNEITLKAMKEAESGVELETLDLGNFKDFVSSL